MDLIVTRVHNELPGGVDSLRALADTEGVLNLGKLIDAFREGRKCFAEPGALFASFVDGELASLGGLTPQGGLPESRSAYAPPLCCARHAPPRRRPQPGLCND